ncbi:hypothetical protein BDA96_05G235900 [Sorghum bicolor]|uniref:Secreted protein n=1 Tax=Sorghum bicolor TaxID=4558 RepID=A0A921UIG2_SORBI|nr:hypothetical protein BDA96_05G235900 [Sorghum bicolor]
MVVLRVAITDLAVLMVATPHADLAACGRQRTRSNEHESLLGLGIRERRRWCPDPAGHWRCGSGP